MSISRLLSLIVAGLYLSVQLIAYLIGEFEGETQGESVKSFLGLSAWLLLALSCIWFGDEMGNYMGWIGHARVTSLSPGSLVKFMGWVLLLLPILFSIIAGPG